MNHFARPPTRFPCRTTDSRTELLRLWERLGDEDQLLLLEAGRRLAEKSVQTRLLCPMGVTLKAAE